ncbi:MAG: glycosyltransferase [Erysipelotrichaceae bacterium]|nr:glycosyltransferase [Erysipelotrichaceae bacterium]
MADKKKVLIFSHAMEIGGAEKSLLGLLSAFDTDRCEVFLFLMRHQGELMQCIPDQIHLMPEIPAYADLAVPIKTVIRKKHFRIFFGRALGKLMAKRYVRTHFPGCDNDVGLQYSHKYTEAFMPKIPGEYDLVISYLTPHYFAADKVNAKKRAAWIHTDYANVAMDRDSQLAMWGKYDHIISISDECSESFTSVFPSLKNRLIRINNILPAELIEAMSLEKQDEIEKGTSVNLLSIGRFCYAKNFESIPLICKEVLKSIPDLKWYIIGYGIDETKIRQAIADEKMQDHVIVLGKRTNPYPYIRDCDMYVQPSRYEGRAVTVQEAQILQKPVVITNYKTAVSQLENGIDGIIVQNDIKACADGIVNLLQDEKQQEFLIRNMAARDYTDRDGIEKIYQLLER